MRRILQESIRLKLGMVAAILLAVVTVSFFMQGRQRTFPLPGLAKDGDAIPVQSQPSGARRVVVSPLASAATSPSPTVTLLATEDEHDEWRAARGLRETWNRAEREAMAEIETNERSRCRTLAFVERPDETEFILHLESASDADAERLLSEVDSRLTKTNRRDDPAWILNTKAQVMERLKYRFGHRIIWVTAPNDSSIPLRVTVMDTAKVPEVEPTNQGRFNVKFLSGAQPHRYPIEAVERRMHHLFSIQETPRGWPARFAERIVE